jgi:hypothetical protein
MFTVRNLARQAAPILGMPEADLIGRMRFARQAGVVSQKGHGRGAAIATPRDGAVLLLAPFVAKYWTEVPNAIGRYGGLVLGAANGTRNQGACEPAFDLRCGKTTLLDALTICLERCGPQSRLMPASLRGWLSETHPKAAISLRSMDDWNDAMLMAFSDPSARKDEYEPYSILFEVHERTLKLFIDLFAANAAKRSGEGDQSDAAVSAVA